jgi:hypothetical protein
MKRLPGHRVATCCNVIVSDEVRLLIMDDDETRAAAEFVTVAKWDNEE